MRKTILIPILMLATPAAAWAQFDTVDTAWERPLSSPTYAGLYPIEVEATPDGGVLVVGIARELPINDPASRADVVLMKLDENGGVAWTDTIDSPAVPNGSFTETRFADAAIDAQGNAFVVVSRPDVSILRRYDGSGAVVWEADLVLGGQIGVPG